MEKYLGVKVIEAKSMTKHSAIGCEYLSQYVGKALSREEQDELKLEEGYEVNYGNGYVSWSPKGVFEKAYRKIDGLTFGLAIEALKLGKCIARKGWNGKGMFITKQVPGIIGLDTVPKMASLNKETKDLILDSGNPIDYQSQMLIIKPDGTADSWVASSSDTFAEDWYIV